MGLPVHIPGLASDSGRRTSYHCQGNEHDVADLYTIPYDNCGNTPE